GSECAQAADEWRIGATVEGDRFFHAVVADATTAADDEAAVHVLIDERKFAGAPGEAELRAPIVLAGIVEVASGAKNQAGEFTAWRAENRIADVAVFFADGAKIFPAQAEVDGEIRP